MSLSRALVLAKEADDAVARIREDLEAAASRLRAAISEIETATTPDDPFAERPAEEPPEPCGPIDEVPRDDITIWLRDQDEVGCREAADEIDRLRKRDAERKEEEP